jgi:hypothetical protein
MVDASIGKKLKENGREKEIRLFSLLQTATSATNFSVFCSKLL